MLISEFAEISSEDIPDWVDELFEDIVGGVAYALTNDWE